jgi:hypothetical protein
VKAGFDLTGKLNLKHFGLTLNKPKRADYTIL